jgi:type II secretory pathway component PulF
VGITIEQSISIIADGCENTSAEHAIFNGLLSKICTGRSLSDAMLAFKDKFSYAEINLICAAEHVGQPQRVTEHLCEFSETLSSVRRKIASAMIYTKFSSRVQLERNTINHGCFCSSFQILDGLFQQKSYQSWMV